MRLPCRRFADSVQGLHEHWYEEVVEDVSHVALRLTIVAKKTRLLGTA